MSDLQDKVASASRPGSREPSPDGLGPSGFDPSRMSHEEFMIRAREAAIEALSNSSTMNRGASEPARVRIRLGYEDTDRQGRLAAIQYFWRDILKPLDEVRPPNDELLARARAMAAQEKIEYWMDKDDPERGDYESRAYFSGLRDDYGEVRYRLEGLRAASGIAARSDETPQAAQPEGQEPGSRSEDAQPLSSQGSSQ